ncbi:hypothetical protein SAMN04488096_10447 [Mesonia phycicola]|uniref:Fimbrial assembly protein (PilN) n=1 Tax=Mesonia phycicola TaxID=579105 RepID=A0A1M6DL57_9FLAO|nr:hypothetical protein [Mesonia phycicola]SHI73728.1 hypothetical protein SAMN04488096_10447 [Mesonia phycicola]
MLTKIFSKYLLRNYYVLHIHINSDVEVYSVITVKKSQSQLTIIDENIYNNLNTLKENINKNYPIIFMLTGTKVLSKKIEHSPNYLQTILFNKNPDDFYIFELSQDKHFLVSVVRQNVLNKCIEKLGKFGDSIIEIILGPYSLSVYNEYLYNKSIIKTPYFNYNLNTTEITSYEENTPSNDKFQIDGEIISLNSILPFAGIIQHFNPAFTVNYKDITDKYFLEFLYNKAFKIVGFAAIVIAFTTLLLSYILTSHFNSKSLEYQDYVYQKNNISKQIHDLNSDILYKEEIIKNSSLGSEKFISFYISEIVQTVPENIILDELEVFPIIDRIENNEIIQIDSNLIIAEGSSNSKQGVNEWIEKLSRLNWLKKTEIQQYLYINENYIFSIKLYL